MNPVTPLTTIVAAYGTVAEPGTVTSTGVDFSATYEPDLSYIASCGAVSSGGTVVAHVQGSAALASGYTSLGSVTFNDTAGGTTAQTVDLSAGAAVNRYYRSLITVVGGTAIGGVSSVLVAKKRTVT